MIVEGILPFCRTLILTHIQPNTALIDATCGNGNDTLFMCQNTTQNETIYAFDIQTTAINNTLEKVKDFDHVKVIQQGHEHVLNHVHDPVSVAVFNLGYLPKGDKSIVTTPETTIKAIKDIFSLLVPKGIIILVIYPGHPEGQIERDEVMQYVKQIDQQEAHVLQYGFINQKNNPPFIIGIEKR
ncbi:class I SAM-dependent methyltransferase [Macrococcus sp. DPC7161]|uniref:tRNA (mnm(5)s(2)U34)-methyltransferase n=1 Tax=Macrococcus sp. DPC7161 TaxID=2507060 RepID=UPI00100C01D0|nr:class I SAM-dependent methyltransferase [Macrococcus sp. DPC7161]RXK18300.1 methyltransferase domain-containing protein [Macrococcus sp. DPC7161]